MKEQDKTPEKELSEVETDNPAKKEFRVTIINLIKELGRRMCTLSEKLEVSSRVRKCGKPPEMKNAITKMGNTLEGINSRRNDTEEWLYELKE